MFFKPVTRALKVKGHLEKIHVGSLPSTRMMIQGSAKPGPTLGNLSSAYISSFCREAGLQGHLLKTAPEGGLRDGYTTHQVDMMDLMSAQQLQWDNYSVQPNLYGLHLGQLWLVWCGGNVV